MARILKVKSFTDSNLLGSIIRINRLRQNMSQTSLVEGICVPSYLSRIENAEIVPSGDVVNDLFEALGLSYFDEPVFIEESKQLFDDYKHALFLGELGHAIEMYEHILADEEKYYSSPIIIDYLLVKYMRLTSTLEREEIDEVEKLLDSVMNHMTNEQTHTYMVHKGMDRREILRDFEKSNDYFKIASRVGFSGKLYHQWARLMFEWGNMIYALELINTAQRLYGEEANIMGLIAVYEIKGQIFIYEKQYHKGIEFLKKCVELLRRIDEPSYSAYIFNHLAWAYAGIGKLDIAKMYHLKSDVESILLLQISKEVMEHVLYQKEAAWFKDIDAIENRLDEHFKTGKYHKIEERYLEELRDNLYREHRKYKAIDDYRSAKLMN